MKVALIYPRISNIGCVFGIGGYDEIMRKYPPLSLAYIAAIIKRAGHEVIIIDGNILNLSLNEIVEEINNFSPGMLGFTVATNTFHKVRHWINKIKERVSIPVIIGGALLKLYPWEIMQHKEIDYAVIGMGINSLPEFLNVFENKKNFSGISGLCYREKNNVVVCKEKGHIEDINDLPMPARELLTNSKYQSPFSQSNNFTTLITSRGCVFKCTYCCLSEKLQLRNTKDVIEEIVECYHRFNIRDVDIYDALFTANKERVIDICRKIRERRLTFNWRIRTAISLVDEELLKEMAASGCRMIMYGIESTKPAILERLGREVLSINRVKDTIALTNKAGISSFGFFMLGVPGETRTTMSETIKNSKKLYLDFVQFSRLSIIPGTPLYEEYMRGHKQDYWRQYILETNSNDNKKWMLPSLATQLDSEIIMRYTRKANISFYLRPLYLIRAFLRAGNMKQLVNYIKAGSNMLFSYIFK